MKFTAMQEFAIETCVRAARRIIAHEGTTFTPPTAVFALQSEKGPLSFRAGGRRKRNRFQSVIYSFMHAQDESKTYPRGLGDDPPPRPKRVFRDRVGCWNNAVLLRPYYRLCTRVPMCIDIRPAGAQKGDASRGPKGRVLTDLCSTGPLHGGEAEGGVTK